jgi:hypothetical protein
MVLRDRVGAGRDRPSLWAESATRSLMRPGASAEAFAQSSWEAPVAADQSGLVVA